MKNLLTRTFRRNNIDQNLINEFIKSKEDVDKLPELSDIERTKFEYEVALDHLYHSSKIEGINLDGDRISQIINV